MKKIILFSFAIFALLLLGCTQKEEANSVSDLEIQSKKAEQCLALAKADPGQYFFYLDENYQDAVEGIWLPDDDINEEDSYGIWMELGFRKNKEVQSAAFGIHTPSGDWYRLDSYCFDSKGAIVKLTSDFRTFQGERDFQYIRTWLYPFDGSKESHESKTLELGTDIPIELELAEIEYYDHPPYEAKNYGDLLKFLEVPESLLRREPTTD